MVPRTEKNHSHVPKRRLSVRSPLGRAILYPKQEVVNVFGPLTRKREVVNGLDIITY